MNKGIMDLITLGVYVLGVENQKKINFMTAAWVTQISDNPTTILVAVGRNHYTAEMIQKAGKFSVNALTSIQKDVAEWCGFHSGRKVDKGANLIYRKGTFGIPILEDSAGYLECELKQGIEYGDHVLFIAEVINGVAGKSVTMTYHEKDFFG